MRIVAPVALLSPRFWINVEGKTFSPNVIVPALGWSEVVSVDLVEAKVLRAKRAFTRSKHAIAAAHDDLESHQLWLDRHRVAWSEDVKLYECLLNRRLRTQALKRLALGLFLIGPIACLALWRLIARFLPDVRNLLFRGAFWLHARAKRTQKSITRHLSAWQLSHLTKYQTRSRHRIPGLDGPLCTGRPSSSTVTRKSEISLLKARLLVASLGAILVGFLAASAIPDTHKEPAEISASAMVPAGQSAPLPQGREVEAPAPVSISGFAVLTAAPAAERVSLPAASVNEIISITRPLDEALEQDALEVTPPVRKPKIKIKAKIKRDLAKQKRQLSLWEQLPWLR